MARKYVANALVSQAEAVGQSWTSFLLKKAQSMLPTLVPGDRLLVVRTRRPRAGDVVALPDPRRPGRTLVKRVAGEHMGLLDLRGDNPAFSTDSRSFGLVPSSAVRGRVVRRYWPPERRGPIG